MIIRLGGNPGDLFMSRSPHKIGESKVTEDEGLEAMIAILRSPEPISRQFRDQLADCLEPDGNSVMQLVLVRRARWTEVALHVAALAKQRTH
jgi:hypothetical protein